jgi:hypothetical protein
MSRRAKTAAELMAELQADRAFVDERARREQELAQRAAAWREAEAPLVAALRGVGCDVESVWDLVNTSVSYAAAVPVLLEHVERPYPDRVREGIARALGVPEASPAADTLLRLYRAEPAATDAKQGLAVAVANAAGDARLDDVIALAADPANGTSRLLLLSALARSGDPRGRAALDALADDPELGEEARRLLRQAGG